MDNRIVYEPSAKIREIARKALQGNWKTMFVGMLIYFALASVMGEILDFFFYSVRYIQLPTGQYLPVEMTYASAIYKLVVTGPLLCGLAMFLLAFFRAKKVDYGLPLEGFSMFGKTFVLYLLYTVKIFLWSLLFAIPGIIATFRYSQCFYLRVDHPEWTASQCIKESSRLMKGNKGKLFCLNLSFFGWMILAAIPASLVQLFETSNLTSLIAAILLALPALLVDLYVNMADVAFYEILKGNLVVLNPQPEYEQRTPGKEE